MRIAQYNAGLDPSPFNAASADVNCDAQLTILDALLAAQTYPEIKNKTGIKNGGA